jgi:hypothetical protein
VWLAVVIGHHLLGEVDGYVFVVITLPKVFADISIPDVNSHGTISHNLSIP